jgi:HK97 family phage portal protein
MVSEENALQYLAVYACVRVLAESVAGLPLILYRRLENGGKERAYEHPLYDLLHANPNPDMTAYAFWETLIGHTALTGNGYAQVIYNRGGHVYALWPLNPLRMTVERKDGQLKYTYRLARPDANGQMERFFMADEILHIHGLGFDGVTGYSPVALARQAIGLGMAAEEFGSRFFGNDARPGVVLQHPGKLSDDAYKRLEKSWDQAHRGVNKSHKAAILEEGLTVKEVGIPPEDAQFLQTRSFQVNEIARLYRIPPHMIGDLEHATFSNIEHQAIEFVVHTLRPWLVRAEQAVSMRLLTPGERENYFAEFLVDGLLRGDTISRYQAYQVGRQGGWLSANDVRRLENMNPIDGGDEYLVPLNMVPAGEAQAADNPTPASGRQINVSGLRANEPGRRFVERAWETGSVEERATKAARSRHRLMNTYRRVYKDTLSRVLRREVNDIRSAAEKFFPRRDEGSFRVWLEQFYAQHREWVVKQMSTPNLAYGGLVMIEVERELGRDIVDSLENFIHAYTGSYADRHVNGNMRRIQATLERAAKSGDDLLEALEDELGNWESELADQLGHEEAVRGNNAFARTLYQMAGVTAIRSIAFGKSCPYCDALDGRVIGIEENYLAEGEDFKPDGADAPLHAGRDYSHAPYHTGCLPGESLVTPAGFISAVSKRWFNGNMIVIETAGGHKLTCTPNHPILTASGWMAANRLNVGGHVISSRFIKRAGAVNEQGQDEPTCIEKIAEAFLDDPKVRTVAVPTTAEDFHGDGGGSKIAIIGSNSDLRDGLDTAGGEHAAKENLVRGFDDSMLLACSSGHAQFLVSFDAPESRAMGRGSLPLAVGGGHLAGTQYSGFAAAANGHASLDQPEADDRAGEMEIARELILGLSGQVLADEIIKIDVIPFSGHVYNLQTEKGYYCADGIITHNCDCMNVAG